MKPKFRSNPLLLGLIALCASLHSAQAVNQYWDTDGSTSGFGTASGTWGSDAFWNTSSTGGAGTFTTTPAGGTADNRFFGQGTNGLGAGTIAVSGTVNSGDMTFAASSGNILISGGTIDFGTLVTNDYTDLNVNNAQVTISSNLVGVGGANSRGIRKTGSGMLILSGDNSGYTGPSAAGPTQVTGGVLRIDSANALTTGTLLLNGGVVGLTTATGDFSRTLGSGVQIDNGGGFAAYGGDRTVSVGTSVNFGTSPNNSIRAINGKGLILGHSTADSMVTFTSNLNINGQAAAIDAGNGSAAIDGTVSGVISNSNVSAGTLTKTGTGTLALTNTNTYTNATFVNAGTLMVNGSIATSSLTTVADGATLKGSGTVGALTVSTGGTLASGTSIESLATGALSLESLAIFAYEINNSAAAAVAGDLTAVTGNLTLDLGNAAILTLTELGAGSWTGGDKLTLISYSGLWNGGLFTFGGNVLADDSTFTFSGTDWTINYNDALAGTNFTSDLTGSSFVTMTAVPEPSAALLGGLGALMLLRRRRSH